jgi:GTP-binding protein
MNNLVRVAIAGRVNVGKSTLFNRLSTSVKSITLDYEGVTRDVLKDTVEWQGKQFEIMDTGGIDLKVSKDPIEQAVRERAIKTALDADLVLFVVDGAIGMTPFDRELSQFLHKNKKQVLLVINKVDTKESRDHEYEWPSLGFADMVHVAASQGKGMNEILDWIASYVHRGGTQKVEAPVSRVVFIGRPNAGKSSLMNAVLGEERTIVSDVPGTTREAIHERITFYKESLDIADTPGIRRKRSVGGEIEPLMVKSSFEAMKNADIVVLVIDAHDSNLVDQELKLAFYAFEQHYKALIIVLNKVDIETELDNTEMKSNFELYKHLITKVPVLRLSCKTGKNVGKLLPLITEVYQRYTIQLPEEQVHQLFVNELSKRPLVRNEQFLKVFKVKQVGSAPLTLRLKVNFPRYFEESQLKFFENILRDNFDLVGVPVKFAVTK